MAFLSSNSRFSVNEGNATEIMNNPANRESDIFNAALERATAAERDAFLDGACGEDAGLRIRVAALLSAHDLAGGFLPMDNPRPQPPAITNILGITSGMLPVAEQPGNLIGRYKLREKLGKAAVGWFMWPNRSNPSAGGWR